jgi:hypothetical protein
VLKTAPIVWHNSRQLLLSLYQLFRYLFHANLALSNAEQLKARQYIQTLQDQGYGVWSANKGWFIKKSVLSWLFLSSIDDLENLVRGV